ncbi:MAG: potassium-transporting ATPase subunit B, partial [Verrucomicrobia bacterium]|nr:potassium-transporting ATPase subunit B [Verrucomicrobiota bacterium]
MTYTPYRRPPRRTKKRTLTDSQTIKEALKQAFVLFLPHKLWKNPVMFVVAVGTVLTILYTIQMAFDDSHSQAELTYFIALDFWLFVTVLFANFATAFAEARGK